MSTPFKLSSSLHSHTADVRGVISPHSIDPVTVFSVSRDGTAKSYTRPSLTTPWAVDKEFLGHDGFVNAVAWMESKDTESGRQGYLLTSGRDTIIQAWPYPPPASSPQATHALIGHGSNVCALSTNPKQDLVVSGSWDMSAKVWSTQTWECLYTLYGHKQAVWAVQLLDDGSVLTGAADNLIKLWKEGKEIRTFKGHQQAVRSIVVLSSEIGDIFASAANDGTIRLWTLGGDSISILEGHDSFVYSLTALPNGEIVSGGEDRTVRIWNAMEGTQVQTITFPCLSIWAVGTTKDGDVIAGSSDGFVRIFSRDPSRQENQVRLKEWEEEVSNVGINATQVGDLKKTDLPGDEALKENGTKEGQVKMIKTAAGAVVAYQWSVATGSWQKIGEVVDAVGSSRKQLYNGQEYDYVFDVDIQDGVPPLKLPYNASENPYSAAQRFLQTNELSLGYIDQVVQFIEKNTAGVAIGTGNSAYADPYTGANRYQPTTESVPTTNTGYGADPFTGAGSYRPPSQTQSQNSTGYGADPYTGGGSYRPQQSQQASAGFSGDPFTGGGAYRPPGSQPVTVTGPSILPVRTPLLFSQKPNFAPLINRVLQFSEQLTNEFPGLALNDADKSNLDKLIQVLDSGSLVETSQDVVALLSKLLSWPSNMRFPGLDLARLFSSISPSENILLSILLTLNTPTSNQKEWETNSMLALRGISNLVANMANRTESVPSRTTDIVETLRNVSPSKLSKNGRVALSTVVLNLSIFALSTRTLPTPTVLTVKASELIQEDDPEVVYRSMVAVGNLLHSIDSNCVASAKSLKQQISGFSAQEERIRKVAGEIVSIA